MQARKLLEYYYHLVLYRPEFPAQKRGDHWVSPERTYVPYESIFGGESVAGYDLYIGKAEIEELELALGEVPEETSTPCYLCFLRTDKRGYYSPKSFFISPVLFALAKILKEGNLRAQLDLNLINRANDEFDEFLRAFDRKLEFRELNELFNYVVNKLNLSAFFSQCTALIQERDKNKHHVLDGYLMDLESILRDPAETDLWDRCAEALPKVLHQATPYQNDYTLAHLLHWTHPEQNSLSLWPGHASLSLREQVLLNQALSAKESRPVYFPSVRTQEAAVRLTLEWVSAALIERASAMARYSRPDDAFQEVPFTGNKEYSTSWYLPDGRILDTGCFILGKDPKFLQDLREAAQEVLKTHAPKDWYTIQGAPYFIQRFAGSGDVVSYLRSVHKADGAGLDALIHQSGADWEATRHQFRRAFENVLRKREKLLADYKTTFGYPKLLEKVEEAGLRRAALTLKWEASGASRDYKESEVKKRSEAVAELQDRHAALLGELSFFKRWLRFLFKKDPQVVALGHLEEEQKAKEEEVTQSQRDLNMALSEYHSLTSELEQLKEEEQGKKEELAAAQQHMVAFREHYGEAYAEESDVSALLHQHLLGPKALWVDEEYNELRHKLFEEALAVHQAFIGSSRAMKTDLTLFAMALEGRIRDEDLEEIFPTFLRIFALLTPIVYVATDYAPYLFSGAKKEALPQLLMPEAGRTPFWEACGPLWRSRHLVAFHLGEDHWSFPQVPQIIQANAASALLGVKDPSMLDVSLADVLNVL
ncbi:hypothetical protein ABB02_00077 [Clostridiaceae bacterium JG1575]|nr:hypothetical protein ABB02_00077 [Clostridiaceae bacterium JG1575]